MGGWATIGGDSSQAIHPDRMQLQCRAYHRVLQMSTKTTMFARVQHASVAVPPPPHHAHTSARVQHMQTMHNMTTTKTPQPFLRLHITTSCSPSLRLACCANPNTDKKSPKTPSYAHVVHRRVLSFRIRLFDITRAYVGSVHCTPPATDSIS